MQWVAASLGLSLLQLVVGETTGTLRDEWDFLGPGK